MAIEDRAFHVKPEASSTSLHETAAQRRFLIFERSEDGLGVVSFDAVASVYPQRLPEVQAEADAVLAWVRATLPGPEGPLDEGGVWDHERAVTDEGDGWCTLSLTLTGDAAFALVFEQVCGVQDEGPAGAVSASRRAR